MTFASPSAPPCALVVDDNPMVLKAMTMLLESLGWDVHVSGQAGQALERIKGRDYDLAIIDLKMADTNGIDLCRQIRSQNERKAPVMLIHSGYIDARSREEAVRIGVHGILDKPVGRSDLINILRKFGLPCQD